MSKIEFLLRRYAEGVITPEEKSELEELTHQKMVVGASVRRAEGICRRRRSRVAAAVAVVSVLSAGSLALWHTPGAGSVSDEPVVASAAAPKVEAVRQAVEAVSADRGIAAPAVQPHAQIVSRSQPVVLPAVEAEELADGLLTAKAEPLSARPAEVAQVEAVAAPSIIIGDSPVVACNSQCSPDSVINDIWNFLRV